MKYTFSEYFDILDYELKQRKEFGDRGSPDRFRALPKARAKRIISEQIRYLCSLNPSYFRKEQTVEAIASGDFTTSYDDANLYGVLDGDKITLTERIFNTSAVKIGSSWVQLFDSSDANSTWYAPAQGVLVYRGTTFDDDNPFTLFASVFPKWIKDNVSYSDKAYANVTGSDGLTYAKITVGDGHKFEIGDVVTVTYSSTGYNRTIVGTSDSQIVVASFTTTATGLCDVDFDTDDQLVDFPGNYMEMLTLELKRRSYARQGLQISSVEYSQLQRLMGKWQAEQGRVMRAKSFSMRGYGFGKR